MKTAKKDQLSIADALRLVDLVHAEAKKTACETAKKVLLHAGIAIADLALDEGASARRTARAA